MNDLTVSLPHCHVVDMLSLNVPPLTQHISVPRDLSQLSCEAFSAGVVEGVLEGLDMVSMRRRYLPFIP
jgi:hypothetical protein